MGEMGIFLVIIYFSFLFFLRGQSYLVEFEEGPFWISEAVWPVLLLVAEKLEMLEVSKDVEGKKCVIARGSQCLKLKMSF